MGAAAKRGPPDGVGALFASLRCPTGEVIMKLRKVAVALGWLSIGVGLMELLGGRRVSRCSA